MAPVGPELPPVPGGKRKRNTDQDDEQDNHSNTSSDSETGPALPPRGDTESESKKPRVIGPSLPPPEQIHVKSAVSDDQSESSEDDDFGPSLPPTDAERLKSAPSIDSTGPLPSTASVAATKRDDWMMVPPSGGDWTARVDPTKLKTRKFNTGKGAKGPSSSGGAAASWHETPQEKQARLQREILGIKDTEAGSRASVSNSENKLDAETTKRLQEYKKSRGPTLYNAHQKTHDTEEDDDPSARAFDREKDIGGGLQINATQRRDMMKKAADFNSRFSGSRYL